MTIGEEIAAQFARTWRVFRAQMEALCPEDWRSAEDRYLVPASLALHLVDTAHYYASPSREVHHRTKPIAVDWEDAAPEELPAREEVLAYAADVEAMVARWLEGATDEEILGPNDAFPWTGATPLQRALYLLRHSQHHLAEINLILRARGLPGADWE